MTALQLATKDTPESLRKAIAAADQRRAAAALPSDASADEKEKKGGLFGWLKRGS
jgi:molecular chaperone DnaK